MYQANQNSVIDWGGIRWNKGAIRQQHNICMNEIIKKLIRSNCKKSKLMLLDCIFWGEMLARMQ